VQGRSVDMGKCRVGRAGAARDQVRSACASREMVLVAASRFLRIPIQNHFSGSGRPPVNAVARLAA
jgi:hypothetical protein